MNAAARFTRHEQLRNQPSPDTLQQLCAKHWAQVLWARTRDMKATEPPVVLPGGAGAGTPLYTVGEMTGGTVGKGTLTLSAGSRPRSDRREGEASYTRLLRAGYQST
eukprot:CAMPEP_0204267774 /NCGR_PEP_ID=MMETSP0468-20130131/11169_1 /ASSEMBLY_ACC=CAM_ASM_000383 /TAXON_ID=2969 /ORGANISM="Oxyrrhis marina" /LENGTH=106 /DNA_ID=CAMNT_0051242977 /DNA_START=36 /DNA_END=354 /DNA_ORIENTATION=+